jgi:hypothetical protein
MESKEQVAELLPSSHQEHDAHHHEHHHGGDEHEGHHHRHVICYTVDGERQETRKHILTPRQILTDAGIDPASYYLVQLRGHERESYKDRPDEPIHLHEHEKFVSVYMASTPVS